MYGYSIIPIFVLWLRDLQQTPALHAFIAYGAYDVDEQTAQKSAVGNAAKDAT